MSKTFEKNLWRWLHRSWRHVRDLHVQRVESGTSEGVPDVEGCWASKSFWIELKTVACPKREGTPVRINHFTAAQRKWLKRRTDVGGRAWLLLQVGSGSSARRYLIHGFLVDDVGELNEAQLFELSAIHPKDAPEDILAAAAGRKWELSELARRR